MKRLSLAALPLLFLGCLGGSDGVENPKLTLDFGDEGGGAVASARVALYARNVDPVKDSVPLLVRTASGARVELTPADFDAALGGSEGEHDFNVVASDGAKEVFVGGYRYKRVGGRVGFSHPGMAAKAGEGGFGSLSEKLTLKPAVNGFGGKIGAAGVALGLDYVFIAGSPYHATVTGQNFTLARLSAGLYEMAAADSDSSLYFKSLDTLNTSDSAYTAKAWDVITLIGN